MFIDRSQLLTQFSIIFFVCIAKLNNIMTLKKYVYSISLAIIEIYINVSIVNIHTYYGSTNDILDKSYETSAIWKVNVFTFWCTHRLHSLKDLWCWF